MRIFQNSGLYRSYVPRLRALCAGVSGFDALRKVFLDDRFGAAHILQPILQRQESAFFTNGDDEVLQRSWAREMGMPAACSMDDILRAQIESHGATVFYNLDPVRYGSDFVRSLPACVRHSITWRAAPGSVDLSGYNLVVCNFPAILQAYAAHGCRTAYFFPAHDPVMDEYAQNEDRPVDVLFAGSYSRHHLRRARLLDVVARLSGRINIAMYMDQSRATRIAESPIGLLAPLGRYRRPKPIRRLSRPPVFGRDLYSALGKSKIVINGAIDMAGEERGNMRCWEAMGLGCLMISDSGTYPPGMIADESFLTYRSEEEVPQLVLRTLANWGDARQVVQHGHAVVSREYSKQKQMQAFELLIQLLC
jgi:hypothetical protein